MRRIKLLGLTLLSILAVGIITAAAAAAEENNPEILPVPTAAAPLLYTFEGGKGKLETTAGRVLECAKNKGSGSFIAQDEGKLGVDFEECKEPKSGAKCNSAGDNPGIILLAEVETSGHLVTLKKGTELRLGFEIVIAEKEKDVKISCGVLKINVLKDVIGLVDGVKTLVKTKTAELLFHQTKGEQEFQSCELLKVFCNSTTLLLSADFSNGEELAGLEQEAKVVLAKEVEIHF